MRKLIHLLLFLVMALWLAMIIAPGMAGMSAFTQLPEQQAEIAQYREFFGSDHKGMAQLVAGYVTAPIFAFSARLFSISCRFLIFSWALRSVLLMRFPDTALGWRRAGYRS